MLERSLLSTHEFSSSFEAISQTAQALLYFEARQITTEEFIRNWEQLAQQALLATKRDKVKALVSLLQPLVVLYPDWALLVSRYKGRLALIKGSYQKAEGFFNQELSQAQAQTEASALITANFNLAEALQAQGQIKAAETHLQKGLQLSYENNLMFQQIQGLNRLAQLYLLQQGWERVETSLEHAFYLLQELKKLPETKEFNNILIGIEESFNRQWAGVNYSTDRQWQAAEEVLLESLALSYRYRNRLGTAEAQLKLGAVFYQGGRYTDALICFDGSQTLSEEAGYLPVLLQTYYYRSLTFHAQKRYAEALIQAKRAVKIGIQFEHGGVWQAWALYQVGQIYQRLNVPKAALTYQLKAIELYKPNDQHPQWIELLIGLADYLLSLRDQPEYWEQALTCYGWAMNLMEVNDRIDHLAGVLGKMARNFIRLKGEAGIEDALRCYKLELKLAGDLDTTVLDQAEAVALRVEAMTGIQCCRALRYNQAPWDIPIEFQKLVNERALSPQNPIKTENFTAIPD